MSRQLQENAAERKREKENRKLFARLLKVPGAKRRAASRLIEEAAAEMVVPVADFAKAFLARERTAVAAMEIVANRDHRWQKHFEPAGEGRDWEGFFAALSACLREFLPIILAI